MEANSHQQNFDLDRLLGQIRELYGRLVYSHKTHEKCADIITSRNNFYKTLQLLLAAVTTTSLLARVFTENDLALKFAILMSTVQFGVSSFLKEYDLGKLAQRHTEAAIDLLTIRESYLSLIAEIVNKQVTYQDAIVLRDKLIKETAVVYRSAPRTFSKGYQAASKSLKEMEDFTFSDQEIDKFLPTTLRKRL